MTKFATSAVLSTSTGRLLGGIDGVYLVMSFLLGRDAYTHELAFYGRMASSALKAALPDLPIGKDAEHITQKNYLDVLAGWERQFGPEIDLPDGLKDCLADDRDPISTLREMGVPDHEIVCMEQILELLKREAGKA